MNSRLIHKTGIDVVLGAIAVTLAMLISPALSQNVDCPCVTQYTLLNDPGRECTSTSCPACGGVYIPPHHVNICVHSPSGSAGCLVIGSSAGTMKTCRLHHNWYTVYTCARDAI